MDGQLDPIIRSSSDPNGQIRVALLDGDPSPRGDRFVCFAVGAHDFARFVASLEYTSLFDDRGQRVTKHQVVTTESGSRVSFCDPFGNRFELATRSERERDS